MKVVIYKTILLTTMLLIALSGKSQSSSLQKRYKRANLEYSRATRTSTDNNHQNKQNKQGTCGKCGAQKAEFCCYFNQIQCNINAINKAVDDLANKVCLPGEGGENTAPAAPSQTPVSRPSLASMAPSTPAPSAPAPAPRPSAPSRPATPEPDSQASGWKKDVRNIKVTAADENDSEVIRKYSVVVGTFARKRNADRLQNVLRADGESAFVVRNAAGNHYVVMGSFDDETSAVRQIESIFSNYVTKYSRSELMGKFGVPIADTFILNNE